MKPNILFITIDSLRADKFYGAEKTSKTPNFDLLIKNGAYFSQTISTSDQTVICLGSVFTAQYPFKSGVSHFKFNSSTKTYFEILKQHGYHTYACVPDLSFFLTITSGFDDRTIYVYDKLESWKTLFGGIGKQIEKQLSDSTFKEPWIFYVHLMDLHNIDSPSVLPSEFDNENYGETRYDRMISAIDFWMGEYIKKINLQNTLIVISSDHGDYLNKKIRKVSKIRKFLAKYKTQIPLLEYLGIKYLLLSQKLTRSKSTTKLKLSNTVENRQSLFRAGGELYDDVIHIPLIFSGYEINSKKINDLVRQIDIFPTIVDIIGVQNLQNPIHGRSLLPLINSKSIQELPAYIEVGTVDPDSLGKLIGLRTSKYKYLRSRVDPTKNVRLYDLLNDPTEEINIDQTNTDVVRSLEETLINTINDLHEDHPNTINDTERQKIENELKKLGYM